MSDTVTRMRAISAEQGEPSLSSKVDNIDLIDILAFLWKSWRLMLAGTWVGILSASFFWFLEMPDKNSFSQNHLVQARLRMAVEDESIVAIAPNVLSSFLQQQDGIQALHEGLKASSFGHSLNFENLKVRHRNGNGFIRKIELDDSLIAVSIDATDGWNEEQLREALPLGLNSMVNSINKIDAMFKEKHEHIASQILKMQNQMASLKFDGIKLFESNAALSGSAKQALLSGIGKDLATSYAPDLLIFLMAAVPDSFLEKKRLIDSYNESFLAYGENQARLRTLIGTFENNRFPRLPNFGPVVDMHVMQDTVANGLSRSLSTLCLVLIFGAMMGLALGLLMALLSSYWSRNRNRFLATLARSRGLDSPHDPAI